jgi:hypothetical protein
VRPVPRKRKDWPSVPDKSHLTAIALRVWDTAKDATGSLAEAYLRHAVSSYPTQVRCAFMQVFAILPVPIYRP